MTISSRDLAYCCQEKVCGGCYLTANSFVNICCETQFRFSEELSLSKNPFGDYVILVLCKVNVKLSYLLPELKRSQMGDTIHSVG